MNYYTRNIFLLKQMMPSKEHSSLSENYLYDFEKQKKAKVLATLLSEAHLNTPKLNRETVINLFNGSFSWPKLDESEKLISLDININELEELGLISFYADWCETHFSLVNEQSSLHESIKPIYKALKTLYNIKHGLEGFIKPCFWIDKEESLSLVSNIAGQEYLDSLVELEENDSNYEIRLKENSSFLRLISAYLWQDLYKKDSETAFIKWIFISRVYSSWMENPYTENFEEKELEKILDQAVEFILNDNQLSKSWLTLKNQWIFDKTFDRCISSNQTLITMNVDLKNGSTKSELIEEKRNKISLDELKKFYSKFDFQIDNFLDVVVWYQTNHSMNWSVGFCYSLLSLIIDNDIFIDENSISSRGRVSKILDNSKDKAPLLHILFGVSPLFLKKTYLLFLLSNKKTSASSLYLIFHNIPHYTHPSKDIINDSTESLHKLYWTVACDEFLRISLDNKKKIDITTIVSLLVRLAKDVIYNSDNTNIQQVCLEQFLLQIEIQDIERIAEELLEKIINDETKYSFKLPLWSFYLLFWLLEKCQIYGILSDAFEKKVQLTIAKIYSKSFIKNIDCESNMFNPCSFLDSLTWSRFNNSESIEEILQSVKPKDWISKLTYKKKQKLLL